MKRETTRFSLLVVTFALAAQLFIIMPVAQTAQDNRNGNRKRTYAMRVDPGASQQQNSNGNGLGRNCRWRCRRTYSRCLAYAGNNPGRRRACAVRYRNCLRRCG